MESKKKLVWMVLAVLVLPVVGFAGIITVVDEFDRPDSTTDLGENWDPWVEGEWKIFNEDLYNATTIVATNPVVRTDLEITGNFSVSVDFQTYGPDTRYSGGLDFNIQASGRCYHARYRRYHGGLQVGIGDPGTFPIVGGGLALVYGASSWVEATTEETLRLTVTGDNTGNCTITSHKS